MEYHGTEESQIVDMEKIQYINSIGKIWIGKDCSTEADVEKCTKLQQIAISYGSEYMKIRNKLEKCNELLSQQSEYDDTSEYANCLNSTERAFNWLVDSFYTDFKKHAS